jgi:hypothetical protein
MRINHVRKLTIAAILLSVFRLSAQDSQLSGEDARLNQIYQQRVAQLRSDPSALTALRRQERDWIRQRDQQCGTAPKCLAEATKAHADYFQDKVSQNDLRPKPGLPIPRELVGRWVVRKYFSLQGVTCWDEKQARAIVGTVLEYRADNFLWNGKTIRNLGAKTSEVTASDFAADNAGGSGGGQVSFSQLGISTPTVSQVEIRHPDVAVYNKASDCCAAVPGETVFLKSPNVIIFSLCGIFYEASR